MQHSEHRNSKVYLSETHSNTNGNINNNNDFNKKEREKGIAQEKQALNNTIGPHTLGSDQFLWVCILDVTLYGVGWPCAQSGPVPSLLPPWDTERSWLRANTTQQQLQCLFVFIIPSYIQSTALHQILRRKWTLFRPKPGHVTKSSWKPAITPWLESGTSAL